MEMGGDELSHIRTSVTSILHTNPPPLPPTCCLLQRTT